ncbi:hypothetical protein RERY_02970 [Rhodococcus erythropolis]|nr:hypothetical protein RERY_02970 [Rhodococcus erythropolis]
MESHLMNRGGCELNRKVCRQNWLNTDMYCPLRSGYAKAASLAYGTSNEYSRQTYLTRIFDPH